MSPDSLIPESVAREILLNNVEPVTTEKITLEQAGGRVLSEDLKALRTQPPFNASAMDGYAVRQADIQKLPAKLKLVGVSRAGLPYSGKMKPGEAIRIFTGAVVPSEADSIVIQENTQSDENAVEVFAGAPTGKFIRPAGLDFEIGETLLKSGTVLSPNKLALVASMNHEIVPVYKKPRIGIMATGDELVLPGQEVGEGQIIASNTFGLAAATEMCGGEVVNLGIVNDTEKALTKAFEYALSASCDLILTTGGASVGDHDLVKPVASRCGFEFKVTKVAMRPGKPFLYGIQAVEGRKVRLTGLAGNPVSSLIAFNVFVRPLIQLLSGRTADTIEMQSAKLGRDLPKNDDRAEYMRASLKTDRHGNLTATPFEMQDSSMLARLVQAECLVYRPVDAGPAKKGDHCQILRID